MASKQRREDDYKLPRGGSFPGRKRMPAACGYCGRFFGYIPWQFEGHYQYCSRRCRNAAMKECPVPQSRVLVSSVRQKRGLAVWEKRVSRQLENLSVRIAEIEKWLAGYPENGLSVYCAQDLRLEYRAAKGAHELLLCTLEMARSKRERGE